MKKYFYFLFILILLSSNAFPQDSTVKIIGPNIKYHSVKKSTPWNIKILEVDLTQPNVKLETVLAKDVMGTGFEKTSSMANRNDKPNHYVLGAVNGDYFGISNPEDPYGFINSSMIDDYDFMVGKVVNRTSFGFFDDNTPLFDILSFTGSATTMQGNSFNIKHVNLQRGSDYLILYNKYIGNTTRTNTYGTEIRLDLVSPIIVNDTMMFVATEKQVGVGSMEIQGKYVLSGNGTAQTFLNGVSVGDTLKLVLTTNPKRGMIKGLIGGGPRLITNGTRPASFIGVEGFGESHVDSRHPRTALGVSQDSTKLYMIVVDGRQPTLSLGMSCAELADYMISIGCYHGVNLDGGGSSAMVIRGSVVNSPSDGTERSCANALLAVLEVQASEIIDTFLLGPETIIIDSTQTKQINVSGKDIWGYSIAIDPKDVTWVIEGISGTVDSLGFFIPAGTGNGKIIGTFGTESDTVNVTVMSDILPVWTFSAATSNLPTWFSGTDSNIRGMAFGNVDGNDRLYIVVRPKPFIINPANGDKIGELNTAGVSGGAAALQDIEVSDDGIIFGCNLTVTANTTAFKVYKWNSDTSDAELVLSYSAEASRLGDKFTVVGSWSDSTAEMYAAAGASNIVYKWTMLNGTFNPIPQKITLVGRTTGGTSPAVFPRGLGNVNFFYNGNSMLPTEYTPAGQPVGVAPAILDSRSNAMKYLETSDKKYLIVYQYGFPNENAAVLDITSGLATATLVEKSPSLGANANTIGTSGDIDIRPYNDSLYIYYVLATNNGYAAYQLTGSPVVSVDENNEININEYYLAQNYPNPFNPSTAINYFLPKESKVNLYVVNLLGEKVADLYQGYQSLGNHTQTFNAGNLASGMYMYVLEASSVDGSANSKIVKKMILMK